MVAVAHHVFIGVRGESLLAEEAAWIARSDVAGVILFKRNFASVRQVTALCQAIRRAAGDPIIICADQEGGRVQRFSGGSLTRLPALGRVGQLWQSDSGAAMEVAREHAWLMAMELRALGLDFSFAPVTDLDNGSAVIGDRAFHSDPGIVAALALAYMQGLRQAGAPGVAKHFPGHGTVEPDTHFAMAQDNRSFAEIEASDLRPFQTLINNQVEGIMMGHVIYPCRSANPAGFSQTWCRRCLREEMGFRGVIFSDDLSMAGAGGQTDAVSRQQRAKTAGCNVTLVCQPEAVDAVMSATAASADLEALKTDPSLSAFRAQQWPDLDELQSSARWKAARAMLLPLTEQGTT